MSGTGPTDACVAARVAALLGAAPTSWRLVDRGYTAAGRWVVSTDDGRTAFLKVATSADTALWLRTEHRVYASVRAGFAPRLLGWDGADPPLLLLEDLSAAHWPPPWRDEDVAALLALLEELHRAPVPTGLPSLERERELLSGWERVARDPRPFLSLGLVTPGWLEEALPALRGAAADVVLEGDALVHQDVRSDNLCFTSDGPRLVDWNWSAVGNPEADLAFFLPSLAAEGGPSPDVLWRGGAPWPALVAGYFAAQAGLAPPSPNSRVREVQTRQLRTALPWAARALHLPPV